MAVYLAKLFRFPRAFFIFFRIRESLFLSLSLSRSLLSFQHSLVDIGIARNLIEATGAQIHVTRSAIYLSFRVSPRFLLVAVNFFFFLVPRF